MIKLLDEAEARIVLLLAPAGYGKTTLARQWSRTLSGAVWISCTPAHRDVATFAETLATEIDPPSGEVSAFIREYLKARQNPQRHARDVALVLAEQVKKAKLQWLVLDDYQEAAPAPEFEELIEVLQENITARVFVASRARPRWAKSRNRLYGDLAELTQEQLAMTEDESRLLLGKRRDLSALVAQAEGWPAVLGLAARADAEVPRGALPADLHQYFAEELYQAASERLREELIELALVPELTADTLRATFGDESSAVIAQARDLGFLGADQGIDLHPLLRDFLYAKLRDEPDGLERARLAAGRCLDEEQWVRALELIEQFSLSDMVETALIAAYRPLLRTGRIATLVRFSEQAARGQDFAPPAAELVEAEVALWDGKLGLARDVARRAITRLGEGHALLSRAYSVLGLSAYISDDLSPAAESFRLARATATDEEDRTQALHGWTLTAVQSEKAIAETAVAFRELQDLRLRSPADLLRAATADLVRRHFEEGFTDVTIDEGLSSMAHVADPRIRTAWGHCVCFALATRAEYARALGLAQHVDSDVQTFDLDFAEPHIHWDLAQINLGLRRFSVAGRYLDRLEAVDAERELGFHVLNARILRARFCLQTGAVDRAVAVTSLPGDEPTPAFLHGEYLAMRALVHAVVGETALALEEATIAENMTSAVEVHTFGQCVRAIVAATESDGSEGLGMLRLCRRLGTWDCAVAALRSSAPLANTLARVDEARPILAELYGRSMDQGLARKAGLRLAATRRVGNVLTRRESEVLDLVAQGLRTKEISEALFISESTTKVHIRHILEKLGVRSRAQAVARMESLNDLG